MTQYAKRDPMELDLAGNYYSRHVSAMTAEGLHAKSDIAAELAYRDALLADHAEREAALRAENAALWETFAHLAEQLGIDTEAARKAPGKPSDVFAKHFEALRAERDALFEVAQAIEGALRFAPAAEVLDEHSPIRDGLRAALAQAKEDR